jgi:hypothetical protein
MPEGTEPPLVVTALLDPDSDRRRPPFRGRRPPFRARSQKWSPSDWNGWSPSAGISGRLAAGNGGRLRPEYADPIVQALVAEILGGCNLLIAYQCPYRSNPITGRPIPGSFFDEMANAAKEAGPIIVLDHDPESLEHPYVYLPSYNLAKLALDDPLLSVLHPSLRRAIKAYDAPYRSKLRAENPWRDDMDGGGRFVAELLSRLQRPVLAILRNIHWEVEGGTESTYFFAEDIPVLGLGMSVVFDIWHRDDWAKIETIVDYFVDDRGASRKLVKARAAKRTPARDG